MACMVIPFAKMGKKKVGCGKEHIWWGLMVDFCMRHVYGASENPSRDVQKEIDNPDWKLRGKV